MYLCVQYSYNRETNFICLSKKKKKNLKLKSNTVIYIYEHHDKNTTDKTLMQASIKS